MSVKGEVRLITYLDPQCEKPLAESVLDLGETMIDDGHVEISKLYVRNEGDRTWHITGVEVLQRPDVIFRWDRDEIKPKQVVELSCEWDTSIAIDDLRYSFKLNGKFYPFSDE